jgi:hypothetical protein
VPERLTDWRERLKGSIMRRISRLTPGMPKSQMDDEAERRLYLLTQMQVPSDAELRAMQTRGELPSDEALARAYP